MSSLQESGEYEELLGHPLTSPLPCLTRAPVSDDAFAAPRALGSPS